jgi:hypothetical protein
VALQIKKIKFTQSISMISCNQGDKRSSLDMTSSYIEILFPMGAYIFLKVIYDFRIAVRRQMVASNRMWCLSTARPSDHVRSTRRQGFLFYFICFSKTLLLCTMINLLIIKKRVINLQRPTMRSLLSCFRNLSLNLAVRNPIRWID